MSSGKTVVGLRALGTPILLKGPRYLAQPWRALWRPFLDSTVTDGPEIEVKEEPWGFSIVSPGREVNALEPWRALIESRNDVIRLSLEQAHDVIDLHAAVLVKEGRALLLLGEAWAGKTTTALKLVEGGWAYFSDDLAIIEKETG